MTCSKFSRCIKDYHWLHSVDSLPSVTFHQHVAIQLKLSRVIVIWTYVDSFSHSDLLTDGMVYHKASLAAIRSTRSRMVSMQRGRSRWATSRTNQSAWPSGHTRSVDSSREQVRCTWRVTIRSAVAKNPMLHANITALFYRPRVMLLQIKVLYCGNRNFRPFFAPVTLN